MQTISISHKRFKELEELQLSSFISNTEGKIYLIKDKNNWDTSYKVLKRFYDNESPLFGNKLLTLNILENSQIDIEELVMPDKLVINSGRLVGYTMEYIEGTNLKELFDNIKYDREKMIKHLKEIGIILEKIRKLNNYKKGVNFYLNDIHEANFILDKNDHIRVIDIDSCKIGNNIPVCAKYLTPFSPIDELPDKYRKCSNTRIGYINPDMNSDLYCYTIMILNYLYKDNIQKLDIAEFYSYLNYLNSIGFPYELLDCFSSLYEYTDNINPMELLDMIPKDMGRAHHKVFELVK